jgi:hypothetical protein
MAILEDQIEILEYEIRYRKDDLSNLKHQKKQLKKYASMFCLRCYKQDKCKNQCESSKNFDYLVFGYAKGKRIKE